MGVVILVVAFGKFVADKVRMWGLMAIIYFIVLLDFYTEGRGSLARAFLVVFVFLGAIFLQRRGAILSAVLGVLTMILFAYFFTTGSLPDYQVSSIASAGWISNTVIVIVLMALVVYSVNYLVGNMVQFLAQSQELNLQLEQRVASRTKALETSAEVSRRLAAILDPAQLAGEVVNEIKTAFNYYYAQIYLVDATGESLVLTAGTGEEGAALVKRGHSLPRGGGLVGRAAESNKSVLVSDTSQDPDWLPNELLPETKAEAAIPIAVEDEVLGVLDVQDAITNDITPEDITLLESLAGQVAISLQNARTFAHAEQQRRQNELILDSAGEGIFGLDREGNHTFVNQAAADSLGYSIEEMIDKHSHSMWHHTHADGTPFPGEECPIYFTLRDGEIHQGEEYFIRKDGTGFYVNFSSRPIRQEGRITGAVVTFADITQQKHDQEMVALRARQQETLNLIAQKIQAATTIEETMQVAARELGHALGQRQTLVALDPAALVGGKVTEEREDALE